MPAAAHPGEEHDTGASSTRPLTVRLLGELDLRLGDERLAPVESARARSLLGYLILHADAPHPRQHLAFLLWPDSTEGQARTNLRNVLHTLRRSIPELDGLLDVTPRTLQRVRDTPCRVDVDEFRSAVEQADAADTGSDQELAALRTAVDLYAGDLLEGCYDEWIIEERERVRDRYISALRRLTGAVADRAEHAEAIRLGRELARRDPLREDTYRLLMDLHDAAGDRAAAVRVFHECAATLQRELGIEPSAPTRDAYAALMRSDEVRTDVDRKGAAISGTVLVGRDREWDQLTHCWHDAAAGRSQLAMVTGEPGIGKTRLVEELMGWCAHRGALVAHARAYPTEGDLGYGMVISWLRATDLADQVQRATPSDASELARLLPELGPIPESVPRPADEAEERRRLFDAVVRTVTASGRPTLLVADDAQWSDAQSMQLVHYLVRVATTSPLLVVATVRREELDEGRPLADLVSALQILDRTTEIGLGRLTRADTEALANQLTGEDLDAVRADELHADTEGNPLFIVESIRADGGRGERSLSLKLKAVISARLRQLSQPARDLLGFAATVGRAFTAPLVASASQMDDITLVRGLDELWRRGVIREHSSDAYDFSHGKIREVAYDGLSPATRRRNHLLLAQALQHVFTSDLDGISGQVAAHYDRSGRVDEAIVWYLRAARQAQRLHADHEAVRLLERAHALVSSLPEPTRLDRELEVLTALPTPLAGAEGFASNRLATAQRRAVEVAGALGVEPEPRLLRSLVMSSLCRDDFDGALAVAGQLHDAALRVGDVDLVVESDYLLGIGAFWSCDLGRARAHFERVVAGFGPEQRTEHLLRFGQDAKVVCVSRLANTLWFLGEDDRAREARDEAIALANELGHPFSRAVVHIFAALLAVDLGERDQLDEYAAVLREERDHGRPFEIKAAAVVGLAEVLGGRPDQGIGRIQSAMDACGPVNHYPAFRVALTRLLLAAHAAAGDAKGGLVTADQALRAGGSRLWEAETRRLRAEFLASTGAHASEIDAELVRATDVARRQGAVGPARRIELSRSQIHPH